MRVCMKHSFLLVLASMLIVACGSNGSEDHAAATKAHADSVKASIEAVYSIMSSGGNLDDLDKYIAADFVEHQKMPGYPDGLEGLKKMMGDFHAAYSDLKTTVVDVIVDGDKAAAIYHMTGTNTGDFMGMPATNKTFDIHGIDWMRFENGKSVEHWGFMEEMKMMTQLGMMPEHDMPEGEKATSEEPAEGA